MANQSPTMIPIVSWPPLWLYWPMYVALGRTQKQSRGEFKFHLTEVRDKLPTDAAIQEAFVKGVDADEVTLALCEPQRVSGARGMLVTPGERIPIRKLPLVIQQPHWLLENIETKRDRIEGKHTHNVSAFELTPEDLMRWLNTSDYDTIRVYPKDTTSGRFAGELYGEWKQGVETKLPNLMQLEMDETSYVRRWTKEHPRELLLTFTPWHTAPNIVAMAEFAGPLSDITSLLVPDIDKLNKRALYEKILENLSRVLGRLADTRGSITEVRQLIMSWKGDTDEIIPGVQWFESDRSKDRLAAQIAMYVRRGCYFPYRLVLESIGGEITRSVQNEIYDMSRQAADSVNSKISELFGGFRRWNDLTLTERRRVHRDWKTNTHNRPLFNQLEHLPPADRRNPDQFIKRVRAPISDERIDGEIMHVRLNDLNGDYRFALCEEMTKNFVKLYECESLVAGARTKNDVLSYPCLFCQMIGYPIAVIAVGATELARALDHEVVCHTNSRTAVTMLCAEDLDGFVGTFIAENRAHEAKKQNISSRCRVVLLADSPDASSAPPMTALLGIFWYGPTDGNRGTGRTTLELREWASKCKVPPSWVGMWWEEPKLGRVPPGWSIGGKFTTVFNPVSSADLPTEPGGLWERAAEVAKGYSFAYLAQFELGEGTSQIPLSVSQPGKQAG